MNTIQKMRRTNRKARKFYESLGCIVFIKGHFRHEKDIFGLFDAIVISPIDKVLFVQIKSNHFGNIKRIQDFCETFNVNADVICFRDRVKQPYFRSFRCMK
jgi:hypothetical protein